MKTPFFSFVVLFLFCSAAHAQNVGVGTTIPQDKLHIDVPASTGAFRAEVGDSIAMRVHPNAGTSIGTAATPPPRGLAVKGVLRPQDSIKATANTIHIVSTADSIVLFAGGSRIILASNGAVHILAAGPNGITIGGGSGPVNISGSNVSISTPGNFTATASGNAAMSGGNATVTAAATATLTGNQTFVNSASLNKLTGANIHIGNGGQPAARLGDVVSAPGGVGNIITGSTTVLIQ